MYPEFLKKLGIPTDFKVSREYNIPYLCGYSKDGKTIYLDKRLPAKVTLPSGKTIDSDNYMIIHEAVEKHLEDTKGYNYKYAHEEACGMDQKAFEQDGHSSKDLKEYYAWSQKQIDGLAKLEGPVPKDLDLKPEHDYKDVKTMNEAKQLEKSEFIQILANIQFLSPREAFIESLAKAGGMGEGSRGGKIIGHDKNGKPIYAGGNANAARLPHPGEEAWKLEPVNQKQRDKTYMPPEGTAPHYEDQGNPAMGAYKGLIKEFKRRGLDFKGHITYDPKTKKISTLTDSASKVVKQMIAEHMNSGK